MNRETAERCMILRERGQKWIQRPELEEMYGFDTKYAMHMLRSGFQDVELLTSGWVDLPMREPERSFLLNVRRGRVSEEECLTKAEALERELVDWAMSSPLVEEPDEGREWVLSPYRRRWRIGRRPAPVHRHRQ